MLNLSYNAVGIVFYISRDGQNIPFEQWSSTDDCIYYQPLSILVDNGQAEANCYECTVPYENLYLLDDEERAILGVPQLYNKAIRIRGRSTLNMSDFFYQVEFLTQVPDGDLLDTLRYGNVLIISDTAYLLSEDQYNLIKRIEQYNATDDEQKTFDYNLREFADIKPLAIKAGCELDSYLQNEEVRAPQNVKVEIGRDDDGFTIDPAIDIAENKAFQKAFNRMRRGFNVVPISRDNGERVRVVLSPQQVEGLTSIKKEGRHRTRQQIQQLIEHATEYFDPECFDLSELYSDRVIELGVYKPKFYPFISPYQSCWIAGATVESPQDGTSQLAISTAEELQLLRDAIDAAIANNKHIVEYCNTQIDIDDAQFLVAIADKQLKSPLMPIEVDVEVDDVSRKVLIIKENAEKLEFATDTSTIEFKDKLVLSRDSYLNSQFSLKAHQEEGVAWLQYLYSHKASGCLMADDMGLGKTLQILYFIDWHSRMNPNHKPYLIVAPVSLLENWRNEYSRFFLEPRMNICRLSSKDVPRRYDPDTVAQMQRMGIILTNYETLRNGQLNFCAVDFEVVVLDEAQKIKTPGTLVTNAAKALKANFKIAMTGTPVENTLLDLWCIMDFCVPGLLGNAKDFAAKYQEPLKSVDADILAMGNKIYKQLGAYFIRRLKQDVAKDLPDKTEIKRQAQMPSIQSTVYKQVVQLYRTGIQPSMLSTIFGIRTASDHPYLLNGTLQSHSTDSLISSSARLLVTLDFLEDIKARNEKVIIFAERKEVQKMLWRICYERFGITTRIINGDTPSIVAPRTNKATRQATIDEFQATPGFNVIIMSPIAAGMGLNITSANHVIHYSRHWNPAKENQATDRAYRIGQDKPVFVYYPMAISSEFKAFDITLDELLSRKSALAASTIFPTERIEVRPDDFAQLFL